MSSEATLITAKKFSVNGHVSDPWLAIPVITLSSRFSMRGVVAGVAIAACLVVAVAFGVDAHAVVHSPELVTAPLALILCVAVLFVMQDAEFLAAVQVLVYAGGIMVLFLFVVMLINVRHLPDERVLSSFWKSGSRKTW